MALRYFLVTQIAAIAWAQPSSDDDLRLVLTRALYPVQVLSFCAVSVGDDPLYRDIARDWNERNAGLLSNIERLNSAAVGAGRGFPDSERAEADVETLVEIVEAVSSGGAEWCRTVARLTDEGRFDLDRREDFEEPLKRLFGRE